MSSQFAFKRTGDADYPKYLKVLLQGPPKSGKTTFIATAPNVVVAACEAGLASIAHLDVPYVEIDGTDKLQNLMMILRDDTLRTHAAKQLGLPSIDTVAIDTLDAWQEMLKKEILFESHHSAFQQADWGTLKERMAAVMKGFVALPMNVIFTVHTSTTMDDESRMVYAPALQGSIKDEIAGYVDFSLLSFRQRETDRQGVARISYYLKCEGDQKNPHLGNRAAGRLPEIVEPRFATLHKAVFGHMKARTPVAAENSSSSDTPLAQLPSHADVPEVAAPAVVTPPTVKPTGVPEDNENASINASGVTMLTKLYAEQGFVLPEDLKSWTLKKGRDTAKFFMAWKADKAAGQHADREDLIALLQAIDAYSGEASIQVGTGNLKNDGKKAKADVEKQADEPETAAVTTPDTEVKSDADDAEERAVALLEEKLNAKVIDHGARVDAKCEECGKPVDDPDIANLAVIKFKRAMCVTDYKAAVKAAKQ